MLAANPSPRIVLVDDHDLFRQSTTELLDLLGFPTLAEASPLKALTKLEQDPAIELLITDLRMPEMSGVELAQRALTLRPDLPVLLMSSHAPPAAGAGCFERFLVKPFSARKLLKVVSELLDSRTSEPAQSLSNVCS